MSVPPGVHHAPSGPQGPRWPFNVGEVDPLNRLAERASMVTRVHPPAQEVDMKKKKNARRVWARCVGCGVVERVRLDDMTQGGAACPVLCQLGAFMVSA